MPLAKPLMEAAGNAALPTYIEDVFSTYLYTGNGTSQTITTGIDTSTYGGMNWIKSRSNAYAAVIEDTLRGGNNILIPSSTNANANFNGITFGTTGITINPDAAVLNNFNGSGVTYASWTFRKQPKFFDVVTYTGDGTTSKTVAHSLKSTPGCMIVKRTDSTGDWWVYHRSATASGLPPRFCATVLNTTSATGQYSTAWNETDPTSTNFTVGSLINANGATYVAYLFAHDAGGFGLTGTDNVISCGTVTTDGSGNATINLGYEPQWVIVKRTDSTGGHWFMLDSMRDFTANSSSALLAAATSAESGGYNWTLNSTGFKFNAYTASATFIYIAIRRGPMKVPTDATKVFSPNLSAASQGTVVTTNFPVDFQLGSILKYIPYVWDRLRGVDTTGTLTYSTPTLRTSTTGIEATNNYSLSWNNTGFAIPNGLNGTNTLYYSLRRAPSFFDEVCYTGTGVTQNVSHNLTVAPELLITKNRTTGGINWFIYSSALGNNKVLNFDTSSVNTSTTTWNSTSPTTSVFTVGADTNANASGDKYVAYLFATCPGVSKVGSYTGTGTTKQVDCGFTAGARFVLIKRTDSTGDWYVWDTARGIVSGNDPYFLLNSSAAETTTTDYIDPYSAGFELSSTAPAALNASGGTYIFLAIA